MTWKYQMAFLSVGKDCPSDLIHDRLQIEPMLHHSVTQFVYFTTKIDEKLFHRNRPCEQLMTSYRPSLIKISSAWTKWQRWRRVSPWHVNRFLNSWGPGPKALLSTNASESHICRNWISVHCNLFFWGRLSASHHGVGVFFSVPKRRLVILHRKKPLKVKDCYSCMHLYFGNWYHLRWLRNRLCIWHFRQLESWAVFIIFFV